MENYQTYANLFDIFYLFILNFLHLIHFVVALLLIQLQVSYELSKKQFGRPSPFGATTGRFHEPHARTFEVLPGPASYNPPVAASHISPTHKKPNAAFISHTRRFLEVDSDEITPDPASYSIPRDIVKERDMKPYAGSFKSQQRRFPAPSKEVRPHLGPGVYDPENAHAKTAATKRSNYAAQFRSQDRRFKNNAASFAPGPG